MMALTKNSIWKRSKLEDLYDFVIGGDWGDDPDEVLGDDYTTAICIRGSEIKYWIKEKGKNAAKRKIKNSSLEKRELEEGDILLEISGGGPAQPVGRTVYIDREALEVNPLFPKVCSNFLRLVRLKDSVDKKFIDYYLKKFYITGEVINYQGGSNNLRNLKFKEYSKIEVPTPLIDEQKQTSKKLDEIFGHLDILNARLDCISEMIKAFKEMVLTYAVTGKLTEDWRKTNEVEKVSLYKEFSKDAFKGNANLPNEWSWMTVEDYLINLDSGRVPISQKLRSKRQGKYPYYGATGIIDTIDDFTHDGEFILISEDGKNLQFRNKPICFLASGKIWVNNHAHVLQVRQGFQNRYVIYFFNVTDLNPYLTGIDQVKLSQRNMNGILIPVPPKEEQKEIVRKVDALFLLIEKIEVYYNNLKKSIGGLPEATLRKAFSGNLIKQPTKQK